MTAEIAIMNKNGIALAADSVVTIGDGIKKYNNANKLFLLSNFKPVGVMIYSDAEFMKVPWEIIIKEYRTQLGDMSFGTIKEFGLDFLNFLNNKDLNLNKAEEEYVPSIFITFIRNVIFQEAAAKGQSKIEQNVHPLTPEEELEILELTITENLTFLTGFNDLDSTKDCGAYLLKRYQPFLQKIRLDLNDKNHFDISDASFEELKQIFTHLFIKDYFYPHYSGIVIAGYGEKDIFPSLISFWVQGIIDNYVKYAIKDDVIIDYNNDNRIIPFAQTDVVETFLAGINTNYFEVMDKGYESEVIGSMDNLDGLTGELKERVKTALRDAHVEYIEKIVDHARETSIQPVSQAVRILPKEELASMAESLVNLTSFKRQVALDSFEGTVGGPIDVAVISRGDGFIWIKRKHYFKPELNSQFFDNKRLAREGGCNK